MKEIKIDGVEEVPTENIIQPTTLKPILKPVLYARAKIQLICPSCGSMMYHDRIDEFIHCIQGSCELHGKKFKEPKVRLIEK